MIELDHIYKMDCMEGMRQMPDGSVDCIITDPPYDLYHSNVYSHTALSQRTAKRTEQIGYISNGFDYESVFTEFLRLQKIPNMLIFCSNKQISRFMSFFEQRDISTTLLVWHKTNASPLCSRKYMPDLEFIVCVRGAGAYFAKDTPFKFKSRLYESSLVSNIDRLHPTQKGETHIRQYILQHTKEGDVVLDPFMGSATTAVACIKEKRHYIGFEINDEFYKKACNRIDTESRTLTLF